MSFRNHCPMPPLQDMELVREQVKEMVFHIGFMIEVCDSARTVA